MVSFTIFPLCIFSSLIFSTLSEEFHLQSLCETIITEPALMDRIGHCFDKELAQMELFSGVRRCLGEPDKIAPAAREACQKGNTHPKYFCLESEIMKLSKSTEELSKITDNHRFTECVAGAGLLDESMENKYAREANLPPEEL